MSDRFDHVSVCKQANVYFDGKCISHTVVFPDGTKKTLGVILPSTLTFNTAAPERMEILAGHCRVSVGGGAAQDIRGGQSFSVPGDSSFVIETMEPVHYVCHFG